MKFGFANDVLQIDCEKIVKIDVKDYSHCFVHIISLGARFKLIRSKDELFRRIKLRATLLPADFTVF